MSAWGYETTQTALALLALMQAEPSRLDVDVALTARAAVLDGVALVLGDLVPRIREPKMRVRPDVPLHVLERDPVGALGAVLQRRVAPSFERSPSELLDAAKASRSATDLWAAAGRQALVAGRTWRGPEVRPIGGEEAWWTVAQVSAIAEAVAVLNADLIKACADRPDAIRAIDATAGLRVAARACLDLAQQGDPDRAPAESTRSPAAGYAPDRPLRRAETGPAAADIVRLTRRLASVLERSPELTPRHVRLTARVGRDLCILTAQSVTDPNGADLRAELGDLARALHAVARQDHRERALGPANCRGFELALHDLHGAVASAVMSRTTVDREDATRLARRLPGLVDGLAQTARTQIEQGRWATPDRRESPQLMYAIASTTAPELKPGILERIEFAEAAARTLADRFDEPARGQHRVALPTTAADLAALSQRRAPPRPLLLSYAPGPTGPRRDGPAMG